MRVIWWLPVPEWKDWAQKLLDYGIYANVHSDQDLLLADRTTKKFDASAINADIVVIDREIFPIPSGYVEYDSTNDKYKIYFWTALQDLLSILKSKGILLVNTGGMFGWYLATKKGLIPDTYTTVDVEYPWGWETISKQTVWDGKVEQLMDLWVHSERAQRALYYYIKGVDPNTSIQEFTDGLEAPLPFTGIVYSVPRALKVEGSNISAADIGFTPLVIRDYNHPTLGTIKVAVTGINFNVPVMIYGISFGDQYDAINVILDVIQGMTSIQNYSVLKPLPMDVVDMNDEPLNFAFAWAGPTHLKLLGKIVNKGSSKIILSVKEMIDRDLFIRIPKELVRYIDKIDIAEETERKELPAWTQVDSNTWQSTFSMAENFECDFTAGIVRLVMIKLNVLDTTGQINIRLRAYTTDTDYFEEQRNLWNWHCYKTGSFWLAWAICAVPNSRFGSVVGSPNVDTINKIEIWISDTSKVTLDTSQPPLKLTFNRIPRYRYCMIDRGSHFLLVLWDNNGNFVLNPKQVRNFIFVVSPTPWLDLIRDVADKLKSDPFVQQLYNDALNASFYYEVYSKYLELSNYLKRRGIELLDLYTT